MKKETIEQCVHSRWQRRPGMCQNTSCHAPLPFVHEFSAWFREYQQQGTLRVKEKTQEAVGDAAWADAVCVSERVFADEMTLLNTSKMAHSLCFLINFVITVMLSQLFALPTTWLYTTAFQDVFLFDGFCWCFPQWFSKSSCEVIPDFLFVPWADRKRRWSVQRNDGVIIRI